MAVAELEWPGLDLRTGVLAARRPRAAGAARVGRRMYDPAEASDDPKVGEATSAYTREPVQADGNDDVALVAGSGLFDEAWYLRHNPEAVDGWESPIHHYLSIGWRLGADPGPAFSTLAYLQTHPDVREAGINPLVHYLRHGRHEGRAAPPSLETLRDSAVEAARHKIAGIRRYPRPVFVYQMAKVGSRSVEAALRSSFLAEGLMAEIHHVHTLARIEQRRKQMSEQLADPSDALRSLDHAARIRSILEDHRVGGFDVVTLVREPVARAVSAFFHRLSWHLPDWKKLVANGDLEPARLVDIFLDIERPWESDWFDEELKPVCCIDVYRFRFPADEGFSIYEVPDSPARVLLIRTEDLDRVGPWALSRFFQIGVGAIPRINTAEDRPQGRLYRAFVSRGLPKYFVERCYRTKMARHFYTTSEIESFKRRWIEGSRR